MQIITPEQLIQIYEESREIVYLFSKSLLVEAWQQILNLFPTLLGAVANGDWGEVVIRSLLILGCFVILYRLVRRSIILTLRAVFDMH